MKSELFVQIMSGIVMILCGLISAYLVPWLRAKAENTRMEGLFDFVEKMVKWANQTIPAEEFQRKKKEVYERVIAYTQTHGIIDLTESDIDAIIEAVVNSVKNNL